jgi:hypothetical protein
MAPRRAARMLGVVALVCLSLTACSSGASQSHHRPSLNIDALRRENSVEKNRDQWAMPLDAYMVESSLDYALDVLIEPCMREEGFDYRSPIFDLAARSETMTVGGRQIFNVDVAQRWGYAGAPDPNAEVIASANESARAWSPEQQAQFDACMATARREFPAQDVNNTVTSLAIPPWNEARNAAEVVAAAERWVLCMQPLGFTDLPSAPHSAEGGTPTDSMLASFGEIADGQDNPRTPAQRAEEIRIATFDAECQESSGYAQALYDAEWERQLPVVEANEDVLTRLLEEKESYENAVAEILETS